MSLRDAPMALLERMTGRPMASPADDPTVRRIERAIRRLEPDPLYRRRLRGEILNGYVARREGLISVPRGRRIGRLGRAVLYATTVTAVSVTAVGAASQEALPGDALYTTKLQLEELRMRVAPPSFQDDLAVMALDERVEELEALAAASRWDAVAGAAEAIAAVERRLATMNVDPGEARVLQHLAVLEAVLAKAPPQAADGLARAIAASSAVSPTPSDGQGATPGERATGGPFSGPGGGGDGAVPNPSPRASHDASSQPPATQPDRDPPGGVSPSARPTANPMPSRPLHASDAH
jgi:hypothetical protein